MVKVDAKVGTVRTEGKTGSRNSLEMMSRGGTSSDNHLLYFQISLGKEQREAGQTQRLSRTILGKALHPG